MEKPHRGSLCYSTKMSRRKRYLQSPLKTLVLNRVFSNPCAPYVSQILFTRMFLECLWHSNKLIEIRYTKDR